MLSLMVNEKLDNYKALMTVLSLLAKENIDGKRTTLIMLSLMAKNKVIKYGKGKGGKGIETLKPFFREEY